MPADAPLVRRLLVRRSVRLALEIGLGLVVVLCATIALRGEISRLETERLRFEPGWFALAACGFAALQLMHAELWRRQLAYLGSRLGGRRSLAIWCVSAVARYVPTSMVMPALRIAMAERAGVPKRRTLASLIYEAALAVGGALSVA